VQLVVSDGPAPRVVPNLIGRDVNEVRAELEAQGLLLAEVEPQFSDEFAAGAVMTQDVPEGTEVPRGSTVTVLVSKGVDLVVFPDLSASVNYVQAEVVLVAAGFTPTLTFGDAQGEITLIVIEGGQPTVGGSYRRGTVVEISAIGAPVATTVPPP
jgi:beta-lactam-binding protein with PASTA domain